MLKEIMYQEDEIVQGKKLRRQIYDYKNVVNSQVNEHIKENWEVDKLLKNKTKMKKMKSISEQFINEVWIMFFNLGFDSLSKVNSFKIECVSDNNEKIYFNYNVLSGDRDIILLTSCKISDEKNRLLDLERDIQCFEECKDKLINGVRKEFGNKKIAFILATKNLYISKEDKEKIEKLGIHHFDEDKIEYYRALGDHLGYAAKYQLLGALFEGLKIQGINNVIPAIRGEMGGHTYYSFSIEPEVLLKLGYVLHRSDSNKNMMPTYQRIIKKERLKSVSEFVNQGGYFPNSIIVSIEDGKKGLTFEIAKQNNSTSKSKIGLLYLPQRYKSIYIIDGQHRLYGYSKSDYRSKCTIPVVAFVNLKKDEQIKLFMEINENQKSVSKNLRNTLEEDMKYDSTIAEERIKALSLRIARNFGEDRESPLFDRVIIGENTETSTKNITLEAISSAISSGDFLPKYKKDKLIKDGMFYIDNNDSSYERLYPILVKSFSYIRNGIKNEWDKGGKTDKTAFVINNSIAGLIKIINDISIHLIDMGDIDSSNDSIEKIHLNIVSYLEPIIEYWNTLEEKDKLSLRTSYGGGGTTKYWRTFEKVINSKFSNFNPEGMEKYWDSQNRENSTKAKQLVGDIELYFKKDFASKLEDYYGENWFLNALPQKVYLDSNKLASEKNYGKSKGELVEAWDCLNLIHYREIMLHSKNWSDIFQHAYTWPGQEKSGKKEDKTKWIVKLNSIRNTLFHSHVISTENYKFLQEVVNWMIPDELK